MIPSGGKLKGVEILVERCRGAGVQDISHLCYLYWRYTGGSYEMLNEINRVEALANLLGGISAVGKNRS